MDGRATMRQTARCGFDLVEAGVIPPDRAAEVDRVAEHYPVAVTPQLLDLIDANDPNDPIARQFVPSAGELTTAPEERADPIGDARFSPVKGIVHRYPDRALLKLTHVCPVYCRFCFRRETVGPGGEALDAAELQAALGYIRAHAEIWEVIVTGGDPLMLSARRLTEVMAALGDIAHVGAVRFHSRVPIVESTRIDAGLVAALASTKSVHLVVHCNHPRELTEAAIVACRRFIEAGIPVLAQTVLLKGVNDDAATLETLFRTLVRNRIRPYYLHHADLAHGTAQFRTTIARGQELMRQLRGRLSGLCLPTYVLDIPGGAGKVPAGSSYLEPADGGWAVTDWNGAKHHYAEAESSPSS